jgi:tryptophanyl-tRNA synthetase
MRPTGRLHIGHYFGALQNWVKLQSDPAYECFYFVADWHALTSDYADTSAIAENSLQITIDFLASGLDPTKSTIFLQSLVPAHANLHLLLSMITPLPWLERIPSYREQRENIKNKNLNTYGFLGYPALQTADIVMYSELGKSLYVPVGEDQKSHVEFSRELVRRFNAFYGLRVKDALFFEAVNEKDLSWLLRYLREKGSEFATTLPDHINRTREFRESVRGALRSHASEIGIRNFFEDIRDRRKFFLDKEVLTEPRVLLTPTPRIPGLDGRKMSKSYGNAITFSETDYDIRKKTKIMVTDPARVRRTDPGNPDVCPVYDWHKLFSPPQTLDWVAAGCRSAGIGCIECKKEMADNLIAWITPIRERRLHYEGETQRKNVEAILQNGSEVARMRARETMVRVNNSVFGKDRVRKRAKA